MKGWNVASGYEKDACGVDPNRGWDVKPRRPWVQALIDRAMLVGACILIGAVLIAFGRFLIG